jgi:hypothetical protein
MPTNYPLSVLADIIKFALASDHLSRRWRSSRQRVRHPAAPHRYERERGDAASDVRATISEEGLRVNERQRFRDRDELDDRTSRSEERHALRASSSQPPRTRREEAFRAKAIRWHGRTYARTRAPVHSAFRSDLAVKCSACSKWCGVPDPSAPSQCIDRRVGGVLAINDEVRLRYKSVLDGLGNTALLRTGGLRFEIAHVCPNEDRGMVDSEMVLALATIDGLLVT